VERVAKSVTQTAKSDQPGDVIYIGNIEPGLVEGVRTMAEAAQEKERRMMVHPRDFDAQF
jgi:hypothetical protein